MTVFTRALWLSPLLVLAGCFGEAPEPEAKKNTPTPEVTVAEIRPWQNGTTRTLPGVVRPGKRAVISTRMSGTLETVDVEPGDTVTTGQHLATVDSREVESAITAARANVQATESALQQARREHERLQRLYDEDLIARVKMEQGGVRVQEFEARLQTAKAELQSQQSNLDYTRLTAPFDGLVAETLVDAGSFVGPGQALMVLEARDTLRIDVPVSSRIAASQLPGQLVSVITGEEGHTLPAHLTGIIPALDKEATGQRLRLTLNSKQNGLAPGQVVTVLVPAPDEHTASTRNWVALPESALIRRGQLTGTLVLEQRGDETAVHLKWIKTANPPANGTNKIPVTEGLSAGEQVVLNPSADLQDGQTVTVTPSGANDGKQ